MTAPRHAWIQDAEVAKAIDESNTIQRAHLREQLIPFIQKIHQRNLTYPEEIILLSDFIGNQVGNQLDYKIEKYKKDIAHPQVKFAAPKLAERPDYMKHVDQDFIQRLNAAGRSILRDSFNQLYDMEQGDQLYPHDAEELGIWQVKNPEFGIHHTVEDDFEAQQKQFLRVQNPKQFRFEDRFIKELQFQNEVATTPCAVYNRVELLVAKFVIREILHRGTWQSFQFSQGIMPLARRIVFEDDLILGHPIFGILVQVVNTQIRIQEMGQLHSAIRGIALAFLRMHHVGLVEEDGILGLDFGLTEWTDIPDYKGDNNSIDKLCDKILRHGCAASAQAYRIGSWPASEVSRENFQRPFCELLENCYASVMTTMTYVKNPSAQQLEIPIPMSSQWVKDELEAHKMKRLLLKEMNWSFCGVYDAEFNEDTPSEWQNKMTKFLPNWKVIPFPGLAEEVKIPMPKQDKPGEKLFKTELGRERIPIRVPV